MYPPPPLATVEIPAWPAAAAASWDRRAHLAAQLTTRAGAGRNFDQLLSHVRATLQQGRAHHLADDFSDRRLVRALLLVWHDDADMARTTMTPELVNTLREAARLSRLATITAASILFMHFDRLDTWHPGLFECLARLVGHAVSTQRQTAVSDVVETIRCRGDLLQARSPLVLAEELAASRLDVGQWFRANHMTAYSDTRFGRLARDAYYVRAIEVADPEHGDPNFLHHVTDEVRLREKTETTDEDRLYFGHQVLLGLTAKDTRHPSTAWLGAVLDIAGDPRFRQKAQWERWWSRMPASNLERAVRWMRGLDLRAFLDGVELYAVQNDNDAMVRMLEQRKRLLLGLYEQDRIHDVRLIMGAHIRQWIHRSAQLSSTLDEAALDDPGKQDTAVLYVDCGDFCLVEGSHNFKLHLYIGAALPWLADRSVRRFDGFDLRDTFPARHQQAYGPRSYRAVAHHGGWIHHALDFLRDSGITVQERGLMTANDYADLSRRRAWEY